MNPRASSAPARRADWSQLWYPGPARRFSADEMARAGSDAPTPTLWLVVGFNVLLLALMLLVVAPAQARPLLVGMLLAESALALAGAALLWRRPYRRELNLLCLVGPVLMATGSVLAMNALVPEPAPATRAWLVGTSVALPVAVLFGWWFLAVWRSGQIEARLREQAEAERRLALARQLTAAQIQPHFLFNALATLQHWVQVKDDRAAPVLAALTGFLRTTLPLFERERLALGDEAAAVREYLAVMALRLGPRLQWSMAIEPAAAAVSVPPGLLLTLVENAIEHGVMPALAGAELRVEGRCEQTPEGRRLRVEVHDSGAGPDPAARDGTGLANSRERLAQMFGARARLWLRPGAQGGCVACFEILLETP